MKQSHPAFWAAGWAGLAAGSVLVIGSISGPSDIANLAGGYGLMLMGSAAYLLAGLKLRQRGNRRLQAAVGGTTAAVRGSKGASAQS
jgi:hypothetical protein